MRLWRIASFPSVLSIKRRFTRGKYLPPMDRASAIIVAHNHPSGGIIPSKDDIEITSQLKAAGETLGIKLLDHIIFNQKDYYSFLEKGS
jgi:DNA repair protein RadC